MQARAFLYLRISVAALDDTTNTDEQERRGRAWCERRGVAVGGVYCDRAVSAWQRGRKRREWERMLADLAGGGAEVVWSYWGDRLVRQNRDLEDLIDLGRDRPILFASDGGDYDLSNPDHLMLLRILTAKACNESDSTSRRKKKQYAEMRAQGKVRPGGCRAFGFARDNMTHDPAEAAIVRELAARILAGESLGSLRRDLARRGITTTAGNEWSHVTLRTMLQRPRYAGLMPDGVSPAAWEPVLGRDDWERMRAVIASRSGGYRPPTAVAGNARRWLLSGIAECGMPGCGARLSIHQSRHSDRPDVARGYICRSCFRIGRSQPLLDAYVTARVVARLSRRDNPVPSAADAGLAAELEVLGRRRAETVAVIENLADHPAESLALLARSLASFDKRIGELRDLAAGDGRARLRARHAGITIDGFRALDLSAQRSLVAACYRVIVLPAARRGPGFDPDGVLMSPL